MIGKKTFILAQDAGGTMTDAFLMDDEGSFSLGKAGTTPQDESIGFMDAFEDAVSYQSGSDLGEVVQNLDVAIHAGTAMLNTILQRSGVKCGLIITAGFEDYLTMDRGIHTCVGYSYADLLHIVTHMPNQALIPRRLIRGVTERLDLFGKELIPLYEREAEEGIRNLIDSGVEALVIMFLHSFVNPVHEERVARIAEQVMKETGKEVPVYKSSDLAPMIREYPRLYSTIFTAYAAEPVRKHFLKIQEKLSAQGFRKSLQIVLAHGGLANLNYPRIHEAMISGPVGGLLGAKYVADVLKEENVIGTDLGGTSFDVGVITRGVLPLRREIAIGKAIINMPAVVINCIGAGTGTLIRIDPLTNRVQLGPDSAGAYPGPVCYNLGSETPTICDCDLVLGILNKDYYLGGKQKLYPERAFKAIKEKVADPLGLDVYEAAEGMVRLLSTSMREHIRTVAMARGFETAEYTLMAYGGSGPLHVTDYCEGLNFKNIVVPEWAPCFSAFGCACIDHSHRINKTTTIFIPYGSDDETKMSMGESVNKAWDDLERTLEAEMISEGFSADAISYKQIAYFRYRGQLEDLEVYSPTDRIRSPSDMDRLIEAFESLYERVYVMAAKWPYAGYLIMEVGITALVPSTKPLLRKAELGSKEPSRDAFKGQREVYCGGTWRTADLYEMERLKPGNEIHGLAILEAPATTLHLPSGWKAFKDELNLFRLTQE